MTGALRNTPTKFSERFRRTDARGRTNFRALSELDRDGRAVRRAVIFPSLQRKSQWMSMCCAR